MRFLSNDSNFVGATTTLADACERAETAADSEVPVFLWGEPGVGKETLARAIAANSDRATAPFVKICCDRLSPNRADVFFPKRPDEKNAEKNENDAENAQNNNAENKNVDRRQTLPSAAASPISSISSELANELGEGTLYLAEIDALSPNVQRRIARSTATNALPFRMIFSSSTDFPEARRARYFHLELETILTAFPIFLPPLRRRIADLPELTALFFREAAQKNGVLPRALTDKEIEIISKTNYPNNLNDLKRYLEIVATTDALPLDFDAEQTPPFISASPTSPQPSSRSLETLKKRADESDDNLPTRENFPSLEDAAKKHIVEALRLTDGIVEGASGAAALLQINPHTLRARMKKMGLDWAKYRLEAEKREETSQDASTFP